MAVVVHQITFHTENQLDIRFFSYIKAERKSLYNAMICDGKSFMPPFYRCLHQIFHWCYAIHLTHFCMTMQLDTFNFSVIHTFFFRNSYNTLRTDDHFIKQKSVRSNITHNTQLHPRFDLLFKLQTFFQIFKTHSNIKSTSFITQIKSEHHIAGTQDSLNKSSQLTVLINAFYKSTFYYDSIFFFDNVDHRPGLTFKCFTKNKAVCFFIPSIEKVISLFISIVFTLCLTRRYCFKCGSFSYFNCFRFFRRQRNFFTLRLYLHRLIFCFKLIFCFNRFSHNGSFQQICLLQLHFF